MLGENVDYLTLVACSAAMLGVATVWLRRRAAIGWPMRAAWVGVAAMLVIGYVAVRDAGERERQRLGLMLVGLAPTYAQELEQLGHARISFDTAPDDPLYLKLIEAQKRWVKANPQVADIYTLRKRADGMFAFIVDSETDYDSDDDFLDEREQRTAIGEAYEDEDGSLEAAWAGKAVLADVPVTDRWGTWVSATVPMRDPASGRVEAVCGVDYPAETWFGQVAAARREGIAFVAVFVVLATGAGVVASLQGAHVVQLRLQVQERERAAAALAQAKAQAEAANQAKSSFLANMSHELRTPLTAVLGFADLLRMKEIDDRQRQEWANTIRRNGNHLLGVINDILDLSKIEAGKLSLEMLPVSPVHVLEEVASLMRVRAADKGLAMRLHAPADLPARVLLDPTRLRQILMNLVSNAIKFTPGGSVTVVARYTSDATPGDGAAGDADRGVMQFDVIDTGIGMAADVVERLFQPFEQADVSTTRQYGGTGLGLTISRRLAEMMGGKIHVRSVPGSGSTFTLELPVQVVPGAGREARAGRAASARGARSPSEDLRGVRVLLAEDAPENAELIRCQLHAAGAGIVVVVNGVEACRAAASQPFDVVLMDMQMPVMDGYAAALEIRRGGFAGAIIALTANAMGGDREKCLAAGCDDYATKPIDADVLIELVRRHANAARSGVRRTA